MFGVRNSQKRRACLRGTIRWTLTVSALLLLLIGAVQYPKYSKLFTGKLSELKTQSDPEERFLLIAYFSHGGDFKRRELIRQTTGRYGRQDPTAKVDAVFVLGNGSDPEQHAALLAEQSSSHDLLHVLCKENCMNSGKAFLMYERFYQMDPMGAQFDPWFQTHNASGDSRCSLGWCPPLLTYKYTYKTDSDSVIHTPNLIQIIKDMNSTRHLYFGSEYRFYMEGCGYGMSWDLVQFIATDIWVSENKFGYISILTDPVGHEDELAGAWITHGNLSDNHVNIKYRMSNRQDEFKPPYDQWILTHYAKPEEVFIDNFSKLLANTTTMVSEQPVPGPFTIALPTPKNSTEEIPRSL